MLGTIEAVLYAAGEDGVDLHTLAEILGVSVAATRQQVATLADQMATDDQRGLFIQQSGERFYMLTKPAAAPALKKNTSRVHPRRGYPKRRWNPWLLSRTNNRSRASILMRCGGYKVPARYRP